MANEDQETGDGVTNETTASPTSQDDWINAEIPQPAASADASTLTDVDPSVGQNGERQSLLHTGTAEYYDIDKDRWVEELVDDADADGIGRSFTGARSGETETREAITEDDNARSIREARLDTDDAETEGGAAATPAGSAAPAGQSGVTSAGPIDPATQTSQATSARVRADQTDDAPENAEDVEATETEADTSSITPAFSNDEGEEDAADVAEPAIAPAPTDDVTVSDLNEAPVDLALNGGTTATVAENADGATLGTVSATDPDGDALAWTVDDPRFEIDGTTLKLKDGQSLDHETADTLTLTLTATDPGGAATTQTINVTVSDLNEAPVDLALNGGTTATVAENADGATLGTVSATDPDGDALAWTVDDPRFEIDGTTLKLKDGQSLDHETADTLTLTLTATDPGGAATTQTINVTVTDEVTAPPDVDVGGAFHVRQIAVVDGVTDLAGIDWGSEPLGETFVSEVNYGRTDGGFLDGSPVDAFATLVTGYIDAAEAGTYDFKISTTDTTVLWIDGAPVAVDALPSDLGLGTASITLDAGAHEIVIQHLDVLGDAELTLEWKPPNATEYTLTPATTQHTVEEGDVLGLPVTFDTGGLGLGGLELQDVPTNWIVSDGDNTSASSGDALDLTGWNLSQLSVVPPWGDTGVTTLTLDVTAVSATGEPGVTSVPITIDVLPEDGLTILDLDIEGVLSDALGLPDADPLGATLDPEPDGDPSDPLLDDPIPGAGDTDPPGFGLGL
ncbi:cadherin domain-containing protein [Litoreibacter roseus]|uniref:PA14 domain-containing protein n=1 Tax=Litoreibacter roseus TaxID=2601869 RepID=A0A6N6JD78_9RHOB|nr:cadherin domain-containing protein [Litoreibacter roseus]GFE63780.1 hypothetical protein KIN_08540 [Litoreibacter roseus]